MGTFFGNLLRGVGRVANGVLAQATGVNLGIPKSDYTASPVAPINTTPISPIGGVIGGVTDQLQNGIRINSDSIKTIAMWAVGIIILVTGLVLALRAKRKGG